MYLLSRLRVIHLKYMLRDPAVSNVLEDLMFNRELL